MPDATTAAAPLLRLDNIDAGYGRRRVLGGVSFEVAPGDYLAVVGSNGSGKSTLLRTLLGIQRPLSGRVERRDGLRLGYVPQAGTIDEAFPITAFDIVLSGRAGRIGPGRRPTSGDRDKAKAALEAVGIAQHGGRLFRELSGGQKQRALMARALANEPDLLVLDEHLNDLDLGAERAIMELLDGLHAERGLAVVMVSHSLNAVVNHARRVGLLREGRAVFLSVEEALRPELLREVYGYAARVVEADGVRVVV